MHEQHGQPKRRRILPVDDPHCKFWLRSDLGATMVADPVIGAWTLAAGWSAAGGGVYDHAGGADNLDQAILVVGNWYQLTYTVSGVAGGTVQPYAGTTAGTARAADGTYTETILCAGNTSLIFVGTGTASVGAISIEARSLAGLADQSINGHDATQATATKQPSYTPDGGLIDRPYLTFNGTTSYLEQASHADLNAGQESWLLLAVVRFVRAVGTWDGIWGKARNASANNLRCFRNGAGAPVIYHSAGSYTGGSFAMPIGDYVLAYGVDSSALQAIYWANATHQRKAAVLAGTGSNAEKAAIGAASELGEWPGNFRLYEMAYYRFGAGVAIPDGMIQLHFDWLRAGYGI